MVYNKTMWGQYRKKENSEMRPYIVGEDLSHISVNEVDIPEEGGMVACNPKNHLDLWYVAKKFFEDNFELAETIPEPQPLPLIP